MACRESGMRKKLTETELLIYGELGDFLDKYARHLLGTKEHQQLSLRLALALGRLEEA